VDGVGEEYAPHDLRRGERVRGREGHAQKAETAAALPHVPCIAARQEHQRSSRAHLRWLCGTAERPCSLSATARAGVNFTVAVSFLKNFR
jgi:hypothetical protein